MNVNLRKLHGNRGNSARSRWRAAVSYCLLRLFWFRCRPRPPSREAITRPRNTRNTFANSKKKLPSDDFTIVEMPPFVVIGDEEPDVVHQRAKHTVQWAVDKLKAAYFKKDPTDILDVWLFKDKDSYEENAQKLFKAKPDTPYGYYSSTDKALVMNIATGGGTLVHEIVHPFVAANFPNCPSWFNEGLGSLYEQSGERDGKIVGRTNWRLPGLQKAIQKKKVPSFETLCNTTDDEFYEKDRGTNYAQARYLCYYLQEKGLLQKFYRRFYANRQKDPGGYATLQNTWAAPTWTSSSKTGKPTC